LNHLVILNWEEKFQASLRNGKILQKKEKKLKIRKKQGTANHKKGTGMNNKILVFIIFSILLSSLSLSDQRGMKRVWTSEGNEIALYKGSYALVVGNGNYSAGWDPLPGATRDAEDVAEVLKKNGFMVTLLKNANKSTFLSYLGDFTYKYGQEENNQLLFYYAGHGHTVPLSSGEELGYIVMVDSPLPLKDPQSFDSKSVDMQYLITQCKKINSKHVLFMFDCCFSGTVLNVRNIVTPPAITDVIRYPVRQFITAGRGDEPVPDRSYFKELFLDLLEGRREEPHRDGYLTGEELGYFLKVNVPLYNETQHPQYGKIRDPNLDKGDFVFVLDKARPIEVEVKIPPPPPETTGVDVTSIKKAAEERDNVKSQWESWQERMRSDFSEIDEIDKSTAYTKEEKKQAWMKYLESYKADNPFSDEDEQMRQRAAQRIKELSTVAVKVQARVSLRSNAKSMNFYEVQAMLTTSGFFDGGLNKSGDFSNSYESRVINGDKVVLDHATGLMWHQSGSKKFMTYDEAEQWIAELNRGGYAGYYDWRLPTLEEGASLLERTQMNGELYIDPAFSASQWWIWTSDDLPSGPSSRAWTVNFSWGSVNVNNPNSIYQVRPVRSGQ